MIVTPKAAHQFKTWSPYTCGRLHVPVKPLRCTERSDVKVTMRKPVVEV
jgi:hypothetical protein